MQLRGFSLSNRFTLAEDVPLNVVTELKERGVTLPGMDIVEEALRSVAQGDVVPHEIGTVGPIYAEEYEKLKSEGYALDDTVGKSGIERAMESTPAVWRRSFLTPFCANSPLIPYPGPPIPVPCGSPP